MRATLLLARGVQVCLEYNNYRLKVGNARDNMQFQPIPSSGDARASFHRQGAGVSGFHAGPGTLCPANFFFLKSLQ